MLFPGTLYVLKDLQHVGGSPGTILVEYIVPL